MKDWYAIEPVTCSIILEKNSSGKRKPANHYFISRARLITQVPVYRKPIELHHSATATCLPRPCAKKEKEREKRNFRRTQVQWTKCYSTNSLLSAAHNHYHYHGNGIRTAVGHLSIWAGRGGTGERQGRGRGRNEVKRKEEERNRRGRECERDLVS